jgi:hypothetical protein
MVPNRPVVTNHDLLPMVANPNGWRVMDMNPGLGATPDGDDVRRSRFRKRGRLRRLQCSRTDRPRLTWGGTHDGQYETPSPAQAGPSH